MPGAFLTHRDAPQLAPPGLFALLLKVRPAGSFLRGQRVDVCQRVLLPVYPQTDVGYGEPDE